MLSVLSPASACIQSGSSSGFLSGPLGTGEGDPDGEDISDDDEIAGPRVGLAEHLCDDITTCPCDEIALFDVCQDRQDCFSIMSLNTPVEFLYCQDPDYCEQYSEQIPCEQDMFCSGDYDGATFLSCDLQLGLIKPGTCIYGTTQLESGESFTDTDGCTIHTCIEGNSVSTDRSAC